MNRLTDRVLVSAFVARVQHLPPLHAQGGDEIELVPQRRHPEEDLVERCEEQR